MPSIFEVSACFGISLPISPGRSRRSLISTAAGTGPTDYHFSCPLDKRGVENFKNDKAQVPRHVL